MGGGFLGLLVLLAGLAVSVKTKDGTLTVTVNEPDAEIQVLNELGKVEITRKGEKSPISISVDPGKHRLKVQKEGFTVFGQDFEIVAGGKQPITAPKKLWRSSCPVSMNGRRKSRQCPPRSNWKPW